MFHVQCTKLKALQFDSSCSFQEKKIHLATISIHSQLRHNMLSSRENGRLMPESEWARTAVVLQTRQRSRLVCKEGHPPRQFWISIRKLDVSRLLCSTSKYRSLSEELPETRGGVTALFPGLHQRHTFGSEAHLLYIGLLKLHRIFISRFEGAASFSGFTAGAIYTTYEPIYDNLKFAERPRFENNSVSRRRATLYCGRALCPRLRVCGANELMF